MSIRDFQPRNTPSFTEPDDLGEAGGSVWVPNSCALRLRRCAQFLCRLNAEEQAAGNIPSRGCSSVVGTRRVPQPVNQTPTNLVVHPCQLKGAMPGPTGQPGHSLGKHVVTNEVAADIINNAERKFVGVNENGRAVNVFVKDGNVVITEGNDVTRVITAYGKDTTTMKAGGKVVRGSPVDPAQWENNPSYNEVN
jgi:hypothetical protein